MGKQYKVLKDIVAKSPDDGTHQKVSHYGNLSISKETLATFQGRVSHKQSGKIKVGLAHICIW